MELTPQRITRARQNFGERLLLEEKGERYRRYREEWGVVSRRERVSEFPLYLQFEFLPHCNLSCATCLHGYPASRRDYLAIESVLDRQLFARVLAEAASHGCPSIAFHNNNEPLLLQDLEERIEMAGRAGFLDLILTTNATLLTPERSRRLLASGLTKLSFSLDAQSSQTYKSLRRNNDFLKVRKNILTFLNLKKELGYQLPVTRVSFVMTGLNCHEAKDFEAYWQKKVDIVEFQNIQVLEGLTEHLPPCGAEPYAGFACNSPWQQLVIRGNGDVLPCCSFYGAELVLGNIRSQTLHELWHGKMMNELRAGLAEGRYDLTPCRRCAKTFYRQP